MPRLPWRVLACALGVLGIFVSVATPLGTLAVAIAALVEGSDKGLLAVAVVPFVGMGVALGVGLVLGIGGGIAAFVAVLLTALVRPQRGFRPYPMVGVPPHVPPSWALRPLVWLDAKVSPHRSDQRLNRLTVRIAAFGTAITFLVLALRGGHLAEMVCVGTFAIFVWSAGWAGWLRMVVHGSGWLLQNVGSSEAVRRWRAVGDREDWFVEHTRGRTRRVGRVERAIDELIEVPDGGRHAIGWHIRGDAQSHEIDDAALTPFVIVTEDGTRVAIVADEDVLVDLTSPGTDEPSISWTWLEARGLQRMTPRVALHRLDVGDHVEVFGDETKSNDPTGGYRGAQIDALTSGERPLVVRLIR